MPRGDGTGPMGNGPIGRGRNNNQRLNSRCKSSMINTNSTNHSSLEEQAIQLEEQAAKLRKLANQNSQNNTFKASLQPHIDGQACTRCGICTQICRFGAITAGVLTAPSNCKGCGACASNCPEHAITMQ